MNDRTNGSGSNTGLVIAIVALLVVVPCCGGLALVGAALFGFWSLERRQPQPVIVQPVPPQLPPVAVPPPAPEPRPAAVPGESESGSGSGSGSGEALEPAGTAIE